MKDSECFFQLREFGILNVLMGIFALFAMAAAYWLGHKRGRLSCSYDVLAY